MFWRKPNTRHIRDGLIAVNYAARAEGVTRHMRVADALAKCPSLRLVHVQTIGAQHLPGVGADLRSNSKACLERYRAASMDVLSVVHRIQPQVPCADYSSCVVCVHLQAQAIIEKASIDEFYIDATALVDAALRDGAQPAVDDPDTVILEAPLAIANEFERRLGVGAGIAARIRRAVLDELGACFRTMERHTVDGLCRFYVLCWDCHHQAHRQDWQRTIQAQPPNNHSPTVQLPSTMYYLLLFI